MRYRVLPYRQGSASAKALATALGGKVLKLENSSYHMKNSDVLINWGFTSPSYPEQWDTNQILNPPIKIRAASNKLLFFQKIKDIHPDIIPPFWTSQADIPADVYPVVCRTILAGHSGDGIVIASDVFELVAASLYVKYQKKKDEYRVHCGKTEAGPVVIAVQRKDRNQDCEEPNWQIRCHHTGFIYRRHGINPPARVTEVAIQAFDASALDFGAVDVIWNEKKQHAWTLEINTAPGLEGQTVLDYASFFQSLV